MTREDLINSEMVNINYELMSVTMIEEAMAWNRELRSALLQLCIDMGEDGILN